MKRGVPILVSDFDLCPGLDECTDVLRRAKLCRPMKWGYATTGTGLNLCPGLDESTDILGNA